ncbi:transcription factor SPT20 homolog isoform 8-T8 [Geothlypis trichas]|uniref:Transcription factor SPT20 homolog isoform X19 n=1 Tax=Geospiza fortis TaxID=48883 RepID=A0A6I9HGC8_GEOFO|nr:transcription factor SPT20 homolog isoform X19 [Geospiza fortis]XP_030823813.1 transcription factor SPT20 homolog isoform X9 [Camarhynchus parvulus]XP_054128246.1 transcription factor SPT20 homolog isoform X8 [Melozone crissalis]XP_057874942.1 transcription factor SPT20 homolog isoform X8 [Melospiza georgiana]XP_058681252.1 transcription factor SPT20 homolog isoform X9 [Ammospiza caudacuta]
MASTTMQQALELALDRAEYIIESARQRPPKRKYLSSGRKSVFQKLYDLYIEECEKEPEIKKLRRNVNLLEKLVMQETLSCLVVNLYPGNEGYSLMLRGKNGSDSETIRLPYEEGELLEYLDAEELPPILVDLLEKSQVNIFHCGCVIAEIRDYRQSGNMKSPTYQSKHILLRPTMQTLICDVHSITSDNHKWTQEDKLLLESQLILATAEPLCLDPSIAVTCTTNRLLYNKQKMNTRPMKRCFKRYSRSSLNRQQEVAHYSTPPQLRLLDYLQKRKERKAAQQYDLKISKAGNCVDMWKQNPCYLTAPSEVDVEKYAKVEKSIKSDDSQPTVWPAHEMKDDYVFECEVGNQVQKTKLTIFQSLGNPLYYGKIQTLKGDEENDNLLTPSQFLIGSKTDAERVVNQYQELVQNEAKCTVKMFHNSSGSVSHLSPGKEMEPESVSGSVQSSVLGKGVKHRPPPIKLPSSSGSSSSGNIFSSQQSSGHLKSPTPPPPSKPPGLSRKQSMDLNQVSMLSPAAMSPASSSQRTTSTQVMANPAGLNFINVVGSVCGAQSLMSGSNPMLGCNTGAIAPAGINLSGILPPGGLVPSALPAAMQSASQAGSPFGLKNTSNLRPLNLLQGSDQGPSNQDQALSAQQAAVINLTGVGNFMQPQATAVAILAASNGYGSGSSTSSSPASSTFRQPLKK